MFVIIKIHLKQGTKIVFNLKQLIVYVINIFVLQMIVALVLCANILLDYFV